MDTETRRGYDLPLTRAKWRGWLVQAAFLAAVLAVGNQMAESKFSTVTQIVIWAVYAVLMVPYVLTELGRTFAKLHIIPEGIAVTLFGKTLRQIPRHEICSFAGIRHKRKSIVRKWIAVCDAPVAELSQSGLNRWAGSLLREIGLSKSGMYLIEWSPERLQMLLDMYPGVPWIDLTEKKVLDAERSI